MDSLLTKLAHWRPFTALVVGDYMLDQQVYGDAERLSPDAPVPVLRVHRTEQQPGGAANVCLDLAALGGRVLALGVRGADDTGELLALELQKAGVDASGLVADPSRHTTVKRSLIGLAQHRHPQKMFRVDLESRDPLAPGMIARLLERFDVAIGEADVVCLEDYNKGVCTPELCRAVIERARRAGKPVLVDPALLEDYSKYRGATTITPNRTEAELAAGLPCGDQPGSPEQAAVARKLLAQLDLECVVLTLDRHGALLLERDARAPVHAPTVARAVYDVTGAGDMVLAALAAARANGAGWTDCVRFANAAAGLEVEVFGCRPIPLEKVHHALLVQARKLMGKARTLEEARIEVAAHRREGRRVVFTNGCFDILHAGHVSLLRKAASMGDVLVVGLNDDASVRRLKGEGRPVNHELDRAEVLGELESVSMVVLFSEDTPLRLIEALRPDVLVKGADYSVREVVGAELVAGWGGRVELAPLLDGRSTTSVVTRLRGASEPAGR